MSSLSEGTNETLVLTIADVIPYYDMQVADRTILMPLSNESAYQFPLNAALSLKGADRETIYLIQVTS